MSIEPKAPDRIWMSFADCKEFQPLHIRQWQSTPFGEGSEYVLASLSGCTPGKEEVERLYDYSVPMADGENPVSGAGFQELDETWKYRVPESLADLIPLFANRIAVHRLWAEWLDQDTEETRRYAAHGIGEAKAHWDYFRQYSAAKALVESHLRSKPFNLVTPVSDPAVAPTTMHPCEKHPDRYCNCEGFYPACREARKT